MDPVLEMIIPFLGMMGIGGMVLIGMRLRYTHLQRLKRGAGAPEGMARLTEAVDSLRDEIRIMREEVLSINDRVEFTERLLERPRAEAKSETRKRQ
jgi:hypothetical protein